MEPMTDIHEKSGAIFRLKGSGDELEMEGSLPDSLLQLLLPCAWEALNAVGAGIYELLPDHVILRIDYRNRCLVATAVVGEEEIQGIGRTLDEKILSAGHLFEVLVALWQEVKVHASRQEGGGS